MSGLTVPLFPQHLLKTGLFTPSQCSHCPDLDASAQTDYLARILAQGDALEVAKRVREAWEDMRKETAATRIAQALDTHIHRSRMHSFLLWRLTDGHICEQSFHRLKGLLVRLTSENETLQQQVRRGKETNTVPSGQSFDSGVPVTLKGQLSFTRESAESCHERLYADAKDKVQLQTLFARVKAERETVGCTFRPDTASSTLSFANSQNCSAFVVSRNSTPCKSPEPGYSAPAPPQVSPFERLFSQDREKRNAQRLREAEKLANETASCTFQPKVVRARTPEPRGSRCIQLHDNYAVMLRKRRTQELRQSEMELQGLTFVPALNAYRPSSCKQSPESEAASPPKGKGTVRLKSHTKRGSLDLSSSSSQVA